MSIPPENFSPREEDINIALENAALGFFRLVFASFTGQPGDTGEGPENDFDAQVRATHKVLRSHDRLLKSLVRWGNEDPARLALRGVHDIKNRVCLWRTIAKKLSGVGLADLADKGWPTSSMCGSSTSLDTLVLPWATLHFTLFRWAERRMERLVEVFTEKAKSSKPMSNEDFARLAGAIYLDALEQEPYIAACVLDELRKGRPDLFSGQVLAELLGGFSVAHISLWQNRRLAKAIDARLQDGETRFEYLLKKAPWTALDAWEEEEPPDLWSLRSKVARSLEKPEVPDIVGDFERQEAARQAIIKLAARAGLSEGERRVFELDMLTDHDTKAVARELDRSLTTVRGWRKRYRDKMSKASTS